MKIAIHTNSIRTALALFDAPKNQEDINRNARGLVAAISGMFYSSDPVLSDQIAKSIGLPEAPFALITDDDLSTRREKYCKDCEHFSANRDGAFCKAQPAMESKKPNLIWGPQPLDCREARTSAVCGHDAILFVPINRASDVT